MRRALIAVLCLALLATGLPIVHATATGTASPYVALQFFDNNGKPAASHRLFTYTAGTSTKVNTYTDVNLSSANANPIVLDSSGRCTIFLTPGVTYKYVLASPNDSDPPSAPLWSRDNITAVPPSSTGSDNDVTGTAGETISAGNAVYLSDGGGGRTAGRWYLTDADFTYASNLAPIAGFATAAISTGNSGTIRVGGRITGLSALVSGTLYYASATAGALTSTKPTNARVMATADSTTTAVLLRMPPDTDGSTLTGVMSTGAQTILGAKTFTSGIIASTASAFTDTANPSSFYYPPIIAPGTNGTPVAYVSGRINSDSTQRQNTNAAETDMSSYSFPANGLNLDGKVVRITAWGTVAANANSKRIRMYFGATVIADSTASVTWNNFGWQMVAYVIRKSATTQRASGVWTGEASAATTANGTLVISSPAETLSGAVTIKTTGLGTATSDVLQEGFTVEIVG